MAQPVRVLMVCMGNICRSPTAEGVFRQMVARAGLADQVVVDSAGTHGYHVGAPPDERSCEYAALRGYDLTTLRARRVTEVDFLRFDLILAMDWQNQEFLREAAPPGHRWKVRRLMEFAPAGSSDVVSDPYYGGEADFEVVLDDVESACPGLLRHVCAAMQQKE